MRLVYFGSGTFGLPTLEFLAAQHEVAMVVTQPDRPAGRNRVLTSTPIANLAARLGISVLKTPRVNDAESLANIQALGAEAFVVIAFGQKLHRSLTQSAFAINLHASLLPKYRGAAPINWAMINGEHETGLSVIGLAQRMDAGPVLGQLSTPIDPHETAGELHDRLADMGPALILDTLMRHQREELQPMPQDDSLATHAPKLSKTDGTVHFDQPALRVRQRIHGLAPWPGCTVKLAGRLLRIARAEVVEQHIDHAQPGMVMSDRSISCGPGSIRLLEVQPPGGKVMPFADYCRGQRVPVGARCEPL